MHVQRRHGGCARRCEAIVCCWTGAGASIVANKIVGIRMALCGAKEPALGIMPMSWF